LRVTLAAGIALALSALIPALARQGYWILLTVLIIMKPGFALTRPRACFAASPRAIAHCGRVSSFLLSLLVSPHTSVCGDAKPR
jgi:hypothetical protein